MRVTIFDYGAGNLHSLAKALERDGVSVAIEVDPVRALSGLPHDVSAVRAAEGHALRIGVGPWASMELLLDALREVLACA